MLCFPSEINQRIIEEVGFEYGPQLKEYISMFKALNSIPELKPIIAKYISIWLSIPPDVKFNYLRHSETLRSLRDCSDSFFISTIDEPLSLAYQPESGRFSKSGPLIFDIHNYLGMKLKDGLNLGIQNVDVVVENLFLLSDKRPKRILELVLPRSHCFYYESQRTYFTSLGFTPMFCLRHGVITGVAFLQTTRGLPVGKRYSVPIDHQTFDWATIDDFDEYPFDKLFRKYQIECSPKTEYLKVAPEFWGPTPFLDGLSLEEITKFNDCKFADEFNKCRVELWSDYYNQLFLSEYCRTNLTAYHDLIETLATEQWE